ncbi:MAG: YggS family pyridoxal phosphate-dependent enzyme [Phycisphaerales bacterium]|nr:MAG: YggS family pyridoxal phosphate-dependent enzyme [Phycisphaerales bacterium]
MGRTPAGDAAVIGGYAREDGVGGRVRAESEPGRRAGERRKAGGRMHAAATLTDRYTEVKQRIDDALARSGRRGERVLTVAVTKYADPEQVRALVDMGHRDLGENRVQHLLQRVAMLDEHMARRRVLGRTLASRETGGVGGDEPIRWHMIGHVQRNKAKKAVELCRLIHTVDSLRLAEDLHAIGAKQDRAIDVLVQVNVSGEESKSGCLLPAARALCEQIDTMVGLRVRGLMTMAPYSDNPEDARPHFARLRDLLEDVQKAGVGEGKCNLLSMGMSGDYEVAIEEGANIVRVGSALFGPREHTVEDDEGDDD